MKMIVTLTLIWMLSSTTEALRCLVNYGNNDTERTCSSDEVCAVTARRGINVGSDQGLRETLIRNCMPSSSCTTKTLSYRIGSMISASSMRCCNTDLCNKDNVPYPDVTTENGLQCIGCMEPEEPECKRIQCVGEQDQCFEFVGNDINSSYVRGCTSAGFCEFLHQSSQMDPSRYPRPPKCCTSSLCNSAWKVKLSVAPLLLGLVALIVY